MTILVRHNFCRLISHRNLLSQRLRLSSLPSSFTIPLSTMSTASLMKAVHITRTGGPEVLKNSEIPRPGITGTEDVLIKNFAIGINYIDTYHRYLIKKKKQFFLIKNLVKKKLKSIKEWKFHLLKLNKFRSGLYKITLPTVIGREGAGIVESVGEGVKDVRPGDQVVYLGAPSYAEYATANAKYVAKLPEGMDFKLAAASLLQVSSV